MKPRSSRKTGRKWHEAPSISFEGGKSYLRPPAARKLSTSSDAEWCYLQYDSRSLLFIDSTRIPILWERRGRKFVSTHFGGKVRAAQQNEFASGNGLLRRLNYWQLQVLPRIANNVEFDLRLAVVENLSKLGKKSAWNKQRCIVKTLRAA